MVLAVLGGAVGGILTLAAAAALGRTRSQQALTLLLGVVAGVYVGTGLASGAAATLATQGLAALGFVVLATASLGRPAVLLGLFWLLHAGWDGLVLQGSVGSGAPSWYPPACLAFDVVIGAQLLVGGWGRASAPSPGGGGAASAADERKEGSPVPKSQRLVVVLGLLAVLQTPQAWARESAPVRLEALGWLAGCWSSETERATAEECWLAPKGGLMLGLHRDHFASGKVFYEFLRIEASGEDVVYVPMPRGGAATPFTLTSLEPQRAVFENPEHDFPQRISYWLDAEGLLHARVEGTEGGEPRSSEWIWRRRSW